MSGLLVLAGRCADDPAWQQRARQVLKALGRTTAETLARPGCWVVTESRQNGSGGRVARSADDNAWLTIAGTWFDLDGKLDGDDHALLQRLIEQGAAATARNLEGFFALVAWQEAAAELTVIGDAAGACHLYRRDLPDGTAISTSAAVLAALAPARLDPVAVTEFLMNGIIYEDRSLWREVRKLPPAGIHRFVHGRWSAEAAYWSVRDVQPERLALAEAAEAIGHALSDAARRIARRFPAILCDVTGGYDSRATLAGFLAADVPVSATVSGAEDSGDVLISRRIAERFGLPHHVAAPSSPPDAAGLGAAFALCDGQYDLIEYSRIAAIHATHARQWHISINGSYGELARAYWWELLFPAIGRREPLDAQAIATARIARAGWDAGVVAPAHRFDVVPHFTEVINRANAGLEDRPNTTQLDNVYFMLRMQRWQGRIASSTDHLWPCLSPFMLRSVLVPVLETQAAARMRSKVVRAMLTRTAPALAALPMEHGYPALLASASNLHRFWPVLPYYGGRVVERLRRVAGQKPTATARASTASVLARDEALRGHLQFRHLKSSGLGDDPGVARFADAAATPGFGFEGQFCRLFTIEYSLDRVEQARGAMTE